MKKARGSKSSRTAEHDLRPEYRFDYRKAKPNRFAAMLSKDAVVVVLDSDVAEVFRDAQQVNTLLRASIAAVRKRRTRRGR